MSLFSIIFQKIKKKCETLINCIFNFYTLHSDKNSGWSTKVMLAHLVTLPETFGTLRCYAHIDIKYREKSLIVDSCTPEK